MDTLALDLVKKNGTSISPQKSVLFESITLQKGDITYNPLTGEITINKLGRYFINWNIATQAAVGTNSITFSIKLSTGVKVPSETPLKNGELVGFAMIQVDTIPVTVRLVNEATVDVYYNVNAEIKAHLVLGEIPETTGEIPLGWQSAGIQLTNQQPAPETNITVLNGGKIPFDHITVQFNGVSYTRDTIEISETGTYLISWQVIAKTVGNKDTVLLYLEDRLSNIQGKSGEVAVESKPISGTTLVQVISLPAPNETYKLALINRSNDSIILSSAYNTGDEDTYFSGSLTVVKVADIYWS